MRVYCPAMERFEVQSGEALLHGVHAGRGPALVFLHAAVADRRMWSAELEAFAPSHHVIAYDRRGFGETLPVDAPHSMTQDLARVLDALGVRTATLVGCSQGGRVALDFALEAPERVERLVLVAPAVSGAPQPPLSEHAAALVAGIEAAERAHDFARANALEAHLWLDGPASLEGRVQGPVRELFLAMNAITWHAPQVGHEQPPPPAWPRLAEVRAPALVLVGDHDLPHLVERCEHLARTLPDARLHVMHGTAHLPNLEQPEAFRMHLQHFVNSPSPSGRGTG